MTIGAFREMVSDCMKWVDACEHEHELKLAWEEARSLLNEISAARVRLAKSRAPMPAAEDTYPEQVVRDPSWGSTHPVPPEYDDDPDDQPWYEEDRPGPRPPHVQDGLPSDGRPRPGEPPGAPVVGEEGWGPIPPSPPERGDEEDDPY